jgi:uncharacterized protein
MKRILLICLRVAGAGAFALTMQASGYAQGAGPSFDCRRSTHPTEQTICNVAELAALDRDMASLFATAMVSSPFAQSIRSTQRNWIGARNHCGINVDCLRAAFQQRIVELKAVTTNANAPQPPAVAQSNPIAPPPGPPPNQPGGAPAIVGEWQGSYSCRNGSSDLMLAIRDAGQNQLVARATFRPQGRSIVGEFELVGTFDPATRRFELRYTRWITKPPNYVMAGYQGQVDPDGRQLRGELMFPGCSPITLARTGGAPVVAQQTAPAVAPNAPAATDARRSESPAVSPAPVTSLAAEKAEVRAIEGAWEGRATCNKVASDVLLKIRSGFSGDIDAILETYGAGALQRVVPRSDFVARQEGADLRYRFVPARGSTGTGFDGVLSGEELSVSSSTCEPALLRRVTPRSPSRALSVPIPPNGGTYRPGDILETRCLALAQWAGRISREYPDMDMMRTVMDRLYAKGALLFADDDFVPVFGFPYDSGIAAELAAPSSPRNRQSSAGDQDAGSPQGALRSAWQDIHFECRKDPFIRDKGGWIWGHSLLEALRTNARSYYGGQFSAAAIIYTLRSVRAIRNELKSGPAAAGGRDFKVRANALIDIRTKLSGQSEFLWPSELKTAKDAITLSLNELGATEGDRALTEISRATDPVAGLQLIRTALGSGPADFMTLSDPSRRAVFRQRLDARQAELDAEAVRPFLDRADKAPVSLEGAKVIVSLIEEGKTAFALFSDADRTKYRGLLDKRRDEIVGRLVAGDLDTLRGYGSGSAGLKNGAQWIADFNSRYREFSSLRAVSEGKAAFVKDRAGRLTAAAPDADSALKAIDNSSSSARTAAKAVLADFLCWEGDKRLPESLEYDELAARFGAFDP